MRSVIANMFLLAAAPAVTAAFNIDDECNFPECPDGWSASACNGNTPDFCCPGGARIEDDKASCCIGGDVLSRGFGCEGGTLVPVGSDMEAYTSSVYAAMSKTATSSSSKTDTPATTAPPKAVTTTDDNGNTVTSTKTDAEATSETKDAAAAGITGMSGAAVGIAALGVAVVAGNM